MIEVNNVDEEDEDVVIQGSALHEHLSKLGYTDFESVSMPKRTYFEEKHSLNIDIKKIFKKISIKLFSFYSWITQENSISQKQLGVILNAEVLLNDHTSIINNFLTKYSNDSKKITLQELIVTGAILISSTYISICKHKILPTLFATSAICCTSYIKHLRFYANRDLKKVISLQNELFAMSKRSLKILRCDYKIKLGPEIHVQQFFHFLREKLQYLQPLTETLLNFMGNISCIYYQCSLSIANLLPPDILNEDLFTKFENNSFLVFGEINYQVLKKLYHTYLLVQSEMLYLLSIAYESNTWICSCQKIPETELARIIHILIERLVMYKVKLSKILNAYDTYKAEPIEYKTRDIAKWHDPTVQLDMASHKLQLAYNQVFSVFKEIDDCIIQEISIDKETAEILMHKMDKAFKEINTAKTLAEFVVLFMAKSGFNNLRSTQSVTDNTMTDQKSDLPVIIDSDSEILDEVFEEYIKEEYSKSLQEEEDDYLSEQYKLDKLLIKNFMSELKEVLIDKHKSMSERESKALQRIYKNIIKDSTMNDSNVDKDCQSIPTPPPMPPCIWSTTSSDIKPNSNCEKMASSNSKNRSNSSPSQEKIELNQENNPINALRYNNVFNTPSTEAYKDEESFMSLPQILLETQAVQFVAKLPPSFLQEETFIGSGETSEDEIIDNASDDNENNANSQ